MMQKYPLPIKFELLEFHFLNEQLEVQCSRNSKLS